MDENRCCGNIDSSYAKDMDSFCVREFLHKFEVCYEDSDHHTRIINGWTEITPDNVDMIDDGSIVIVTDGTYYNKASEWHLSIGTMAKYGGYYYYVLPELKIE